MFDGRTDDDYFSGFLSEMKLDIKKLKPPGFTSATINNAIEMEISRRAASKLEDRLKDLDDVQIVSIQAFIEKNPESIASEIPLEQPKKPRKYRGEIN